MYIYNLGLQQSKLYKLMKYIYNGSNYKQTLIDRSHNVQNDVLKLKAVQHKPS